jgi:hypothetical protein
VASEFENMLRAQVQANLTHALDSAVQAGDIQAARRASEQLNKVNNTAEKPSAPTFTNTDIRDKLKEKAPWFGRDPRWSAKAVEFGKNMEPTHFNSAEEFADALVKAVEDEFEPREPDDEPEDGSEEEEKETAVKSARKRTDAPSSSGARAVPRRSSGPWTKLADAPKDVAAQIKASADKFTRNASKEQRAKYVETALGAAYTAAQRNKK